MNAVERAQPLVERFEGFAKQLADGMVAAYLDAVNVPTIGWGSTGPDITIRTRWTREQCRERLLEGMRKALAGVLRSSPALARDEVRAAAMLDFAYNLGAGAYQGSTLRRRVNEGDWQEAANQCRRWVNAGGRKLPGLVLRRELEALMLERGI